MCRTVSKALLKSNAIMATYRTGCVIGNQFTACRSEMSAAVVEPVGRKAYWSWKSRQVGGSRNAG